MRGSSVCFCCMCSLPPLAGGCKAKGKPRHSQHSQGCSGTGARLDFDPNFSASLARCYAWKPSISVGTPFLWGELREPRAPTAAYTRVGHPRLHEVPPGGVVGGAHPNPAPSGHPRRCAPVARSEKGPEQKPTSEPLLNRLTRFP